MGAIGLPGDLSSQSRFIRAAFVKMNSVSKEEEKEIAKKILQDCMENVTKLEIPLKVEVSEAKDWYDAK